MGQKCTIVANAYKTPIFVKADAERQYVSLDANAMKVCSDK